MNFLEKFFKFSENNTDIKTEVTGGITTFLTMCYILFVNPVILSKAGLPFAETVTATAWAAGLSTLLMGLLSNYPLACAAGMGLNAMLAFSIVLGMNVSWQIGMGMIVLEGILITVLVLTNLREMVMNAIPLPLKHSIGIGIGLFIAFIGLKDAGFVVSNPVTFVMAGNFSEKAVWISSIGLIVSVILLIRKTRGALLWGMGAAALAGILLGSLSAPTQVFSKPAWPSTFLQCDVKGALQWAFLPMIFSFFMVDFFDTMGTVIAVGGEGNFLGPDGKLPRLKKVLLADSLAAVIGGLFSSSSATTYVESASGVAQGARTGFSSVIVAILFFAAPFFTPLVQMAGGGVPTASGILNPVTAPALIIVGFLMIALVKEIHWADPEESFPAFLILAGIPLTFSISHGIGLGFISYTLIKIFRGKFREVPPLLYCISLLFALSFLIH